MPCTINNNSAIRRLYVECQESILNKYSVPLDKKIILNNIDYLVLSIPSSNYSRIESGEKTSLVDTFRYPFIMPRLIKVGFNVKVDDNDIRVFKCLSFLALSSNSTALSNVFVPVTILDYVRPEVNDLSFTSRKGVLNVFSANGFAGSLNENPLYVEPYDINFQEINKRFV
jgi:hypothetical protein